jgi:hypothetical protein
MLPRVTEIVEAAGLGANQVAQRPGNVRVDAIANIFDSRDPARAEEEVLDLIDTVIGVYQGTRYGAWRRTVNPLHYAGVAIGFVLGLPRRGLIATGLIGERREPPLLEAGHVTMLEAAATRLAAGQDSIETRLAEMDDRQERRLAENAEQLTELAERLDFAERVMAQQRSTGPAEARGREKPVTPA